jgi:tungstate transport system permease protein
MILKSIIDAFYLLFKLDKEVLSLIETSFYVASISTLIAAIIAFPIGIWFGLSEFKGRKTLDVILNTMLFFPTVVIGNFVYMLLTRHGPFGRFDLLFSRPAIIIGQVILVAPLILTMVANSVRSADRRILQTAFTLGAGQVKSHIALLGEVKGLILLAMFAGFGRAISEVGVAMMLGGNIKGKTRTITTGMALLTSQGDFAKATALGIVLLVLVYIINFLVYTATHRQKS